MSLDLAAQALSRFRSLRSRGALSLQEAQSLAATAVQGFFAHHAAFGEVSEEAVQLLCQMAVLDDEDLAAIGLRGIFDSLVERLSDSFDPDLCPLYDRAFAQVVDFCRRLPAGRPLDEQLDRFGLRTREALLWRKARLRDSPAPPQGQPDQVRKVLIPSRVTLGAEVAVTSIVMAKMKRVFPRSEIVLLAAPTMADVFAGDERVRVREVNYSRGGGLIHRLNGWLEAVRATDEEVKNLRPSQYIVIDPDSRLTQLGLLPLVEDDSRYHFFESRSFRQPGVEGIGPLTAIWLNQRFGGEEEILPYLALKGSHRAFAKALCGGLRREGGKPVVTVSFGVGGNPRKRLPDPFEAELLERLLGEATVILIKGVGQEELRRSDALVAQFQLGGRKVIQLKGMDLPRLPPLGVDLVAWEGPVGAFCALIGESDAYLGYDSAGQHIAAAQGVPTVDIFADNTYPMIPKRWRPYGPGKVEVVQVEPSGDAEVALDQVMRALAMALAS